MTPGVHDIPAAEYHADPCPSPSLSASIVQTLNEQSPAHAKTAHPRLNPNAKSDEGTELDLGAAGHALLFEGQNRIVEVSANDWRTKVAQEARDTARAEGKHPILTHKVPALYAMVDAARRKWNECDDLKGFRLENGKSEQTIIWQEDGLWMRCKPDYMATNRRLIVDGKFTKTSAHPAAFCNQIERMGYDSRGSFYLRGNAATGGFPDAKYVYLIQEITPPYATAFIGLAPSMVALGDMKVAQAISTWRHCLQNDTWPDYGKSIAWAEAQGWMETKWLERENVNGIPYDPAVLFGGIER